MNHNRIVFLLCLVALPFVECRGKKGWENPTVQWDESWNGYVHYPPEAVALLDTRPGRMPAILDVLTDVAEVDNPLMALLKGIVYRTHHRTLINPHYFIQDGILIDWDTGKTEWCTDHPIDNQQPIDSDNVAPSGNCSLHCTNNGRYCLNNHHWYGGRLVKEAARRMCFEYVTHDGGSTVLWKYLEQYQQADCQLEHDVTACSIKVMDAMDEINSEDVLDCIENAGGFEGDRENEELKTQIHFQEELGLVADKDTHEEMPMMDIMGHPYTGHFTVKDIFHQVCAAFPVDEQPLACDFCAKCNDVRKCLWQWQCDGKAFDAKDFPHRAHLNSTATTFDLSHYASQQDNAAIGEEDRGSGPTRWQTGFLWGAIAGLLVALLFVYREFRTRRHVKELLEFRTADDFVPRAIPEVGELVQDLDVKNHGLLLRKDIRNDYTRQTRSLWTPPRGGSSSRLLSTPGSTPPRGSSTPGSTPPSSLGSLGSLSAASTPPSDDEGGDLLPSIV